MLLVVVLAAPAGGIRWRSGNVSPLVVDDAGVVVTVMVADPVSQIVARTRFVAALRGEVEVHVRAN